MNAFVGFGSLKGSACNLFIVTAYIPHGSRVRPSRTDTINELDLICKQVKQGDCLVVMGDFNVQLPANKKSQTGRYVCATNESEGATEVLGFMKTHDLFTINTKFRKRKQTPTTYLHVVSQGDEDEDLNTN